MPSAPKIKEKNPYADEGARLRTLRKALFEGTMEAFAASIRCEKSYWSELESGKRRISLNAACELYKEWGVSLDYAYFGRVECLPADLRARLARRSA